jgi:2,3-bisphosphoglycerate-independent phosphoglycerate mutase
LGIDFDLKKRDVAARGNFCTIDEKGLVTDRRAGRISTEENAKLCKKLSKIKLEGAQVLVAPVKEHRFLLVLRGAGLTGDASDSDPEVVGVAPLKIVANSPKGKKTARLANQFVAKAKAVLSGSHPANMVLLRGFSQHPELPSMTEIFKLNPAAIAAYPMYRGLAKLVGMELLNTGSTIEEEFDTLVRRYAEHDFFFIHFKKTDSSGEDGDFDAKVRVLEEIDRFLPKITALNPDVLIVTGDHSTPAVLKGHSWHPVPIVLYSKWCRTDHVHEFGETACASGGLGRFPAVEVMSLAMANALKLTKFGA